jgi:hypothetical protein
MHFEELICGDLCHADLTANDLDDIAKIFEKVCGNINEMR